MKLIESRKDVGVYLGFPFCQTPCSFCHYKPNLLFGIQSIPDAYINCMCRQAEELLDQNSIHERFFSSLYLGGGTPSLLSLSQLERILSVFDKRRISFRESSVELHPAFTNLDLISCGLFNRFSIGVQTTETRQLAAWRRPHDTAEKVVALVSRIRDRDPTAVINLDFLFLEAVPDADIGFVNAIQPDSVVFYPKTGQRTERQAASTILSIDNLGTSLPGYYRRNRLSFHFFKEWKNHSQYAEACYGFNSDILGLGHNSVSRFGTESFLSVFDRSFSSWQLNPRQRNVPLETAWQSLLYGVPPVLQSVLPAHVQRMLVFDKHFDSTHLPFDRQAWNNVFDGLSSFDTKTAEFCRGCFFWSDGREKDIDSVFDFYETMRQDWINQQFNETFKPLPLPQLTVLIEGIDGSGKDTFAKFLFESLTRLFHRKNGRSVSIVGLPSSAIEFGQDCRRFIEEGSASIPACEMGSMLKSNRCRSLDRFKADHPGIQILIRGEWTERATMERVYGIHEEPGPCEGVDMVIFVKTRPIIARKRVESRGTRITWRETLPELEFFNDFYWNSFLRTQDAFLVENDVDSMDNLRVQAIQLAHVIYRRISALGT